MKTTKQEYSDQAKLVLDRWCGSGLYHYIPTDPDKGEDPNAYLELHGLIVAALEQCVTAETERAVQIALQYRDEIENGKHSGVGDPERAMGQGYAANLIAKRIRAK